jgi:hypothetical protein
VQRIAQELRITNEHSEKNDFSISVRIVKKVILFQMVEILFGLFIWNSNGELRRTITILSPLWNSRITAILTISEQQICVWMYNCYSYSENSGYSAIPDPSKHTLNDL